ncbi:hypothetical protein B0H13DRAFT_1932722 [Mycena leptocephala]|nr:hypothetical protein B0H13DRAFT_1932722 [Mycena leptocephala]
MSDPVSFLSTLAPFNSDGLLVTIVVSGLIAFVFIVRFVFPSRMIRSLDTALDDVERLYFDSFEKHRFNRPSLESKADVDLATRLINLEERADQLRIQTLFHGTFFVQWGELWGVCSGHSFAIWRCTRQVQCLGNEMQASELPVGEMRKPERVLDHTPGEAQRIKHSPANQSLSSVAVDDASEELVPRYQLRARLLVQATRPFDFFFYVYYTKHLVQPVEPPTPTKSANERRSPHRKRKDIEKGLRNRMSQDLATHSTFYSWRGPNDIIGVWPPKLDPT